MFRMGKEALDSYKKGWYRTHRAVLKAPMSLVSYNWGGAQQQCVGAPVREPTDLLQFGSDMFKRAYRYTNTLPNYDAWSSEQSEDFKVPSNYDPKALNGIIYPELGELHSHLDGPLGTKNC